MENRLAKELTIVSSRCDSTARLSVPGAFDLCIDLAGEHAEALGNGIGSMMERGLFWVAVKTKLRFVRRPRIMERVTLETWPEPPGRMKQNRSYRMTAEGETLLTGKTEWTVLDTGAGGLHSPRDGIYAPALEFCAEQSCPAPFHRFRDDFADAPFARYTVRSTDIDMGKHMNNVAYVRMLAGLFPTEEWNAMDPREAELHYRSQCHEGDELLLQKRTAPDGALEIRAALADGTTILLARIVRA